jgi:hypothetical protein
MGFIVGQCRLLNFDYPASLQFRKLFGAVQYPSCPGDVIIMSAPLKLALAGLTSATAVDTAVQMVTDSWSKPGLYALLTTLRLPVRQGPYNRVESVVPLPKE